mmetsp:Transcript_27428/g.49898  ORF Transcript_27428/g.49898 Transcript_27428/m.49898 type:complete len:87 (+) Transcript_27428:653-913(+)
MAGTGANWRSYNHNTGRCTCVTCTENVLVCEGFDDDDDDSPTPPPVSMHPPVPTPTPTSDAMSRNMALSLYSVVINAVAIASIALF